MGDPLNDNKDVQYQKLVDARKKCALCKAKPDYELLNASSIQHGRFDSQELGPWSLWHADLNAAVLVIGKDFGSVAYFEKNNGCDEIENPTNSALINDLKHAGISLTPPKRVPHAPNKGSGFFFSNSVLCLARDHKNLGNESMTTKVYPEWVKTCSSYYLGKLISILAPKIIISLGKEALYAVAVALDKQNDWGIDNNLNFLLASKVDRAAPFQANEILVFPVFHSSFRHINRGSELNKSDWSRIKEQILIALGNKT